MSVSLNSERQEHLQDHRDWKLVGRIVGSRCFGKSQRLKSFLLFISERVIQGQSSEISEQQIGVHVFGRSPDYNPGDDSIVRSHARLLRQRLELYFEQEGAHEARQVTIPKGSYIPVFGDRSRKAREISPLETELLPEVLVTPALPPAETGLRKPKWRISSAWAATAAGALGLTLGFLLHSVGTQRAVPEHPFWSRIFNRDMETLYVSGDNGLVLHENLTGTTVSLPQYVTRNYGREPSRVPALSDSFVADLSWRRYTGALDANFALRLTRLSDVDPHRFQVRYARDLQVEDLKRYNAIVSGAAEANPWVELFQDKLNFRLVDDQVTHIFHVLNKAPQSDERRSYESNANAPSRPASGHIALVANLSSTGSVLLIEGTGSAGTEAAQDFLLSSRQLDLVLAQLGRERNGELPHFELLVETTFLADSRAPTSKLIALRKLP